MSMDPRRMMELIRRTQGAAPQQRPDDITHRTSGTGYNEHGYAMPNRGQVDGVPRPAPRQAAPHQAHRPSLSQDAQRFAGVDLARWEGEYAAEHGHAVGAGNGEDKVQAVANLLRSLDSPNESFESYYYTDQANNTPRNQRYRAIADELINGGGQVVDLPGPGRAIASGDPLGAYGTDVERWYADRHDLRDPQRAPAAFARFAGLLGGPDDPSWGQTTVGNSDPSPDPHANSGATRDGRGPRADDVVARPVRPSYDDPNIASGGSFGNQRQQNGPTRASNGALISAANTSVPSPRGSAATNQYAGAYGVQRETQADMDRGRAAGARNRTGTVSTQTISDVADHAVGAFGEGFYGGVAGLMRGVAAAGDHISDAISGGESPESVTNNPIYRAANSLEERARQDAAGWQEEQYKDDFFSDVARGAGGMAPIVGGALINPALGVAAGAGQGLGGNTQRGVEGGLTGQQLEEYQAVGAAQGVAEGVVGQIPLGGPAARALSRFLPRSRVLASAVAEGLEGSISSVVQDLVDNEYLRTGLPVEQILGNAARNGALEATIGSLLGGATNVTGRVNERGPRPQQASAPEAPAEVEAPPVQAGQQEAQTSLPPQVEEAPAPERQPRENPFASPRQALRQSEQVDVPTENRVVGGKLVANQPVVPPVTNPTLEGIQDPQQFYGTPSQGQVSSGRGLGVYQTDMSSQVLSQNIEDAYRQAARRLGISEMQFEQLRMAPNRDQNSRWKLIQTEAYQPQNNTYTPLTGRVDAPERPAQRPAYGSTSEAIPDVSQPPLLDMSEVPSVRTPSVPAQPVRAVQPPLISDEMLAPPPASQAPEPFNTTKPDTSSVPQGVSDEVLFLNQRYSKRLITPTQFRQGMGAIDSKYSLPKGTSEAVLFDLSRRGRVQPQKAQTAPTPDFGKTPAPVAPQPQQQAVPAPQTQAPQAPQAPRASVPAPQAQPPIVAQTAPQAPTQQTAPDPDPAPALAQGTRVVYKPTGQEGVISSNQLAEKSPSGTRYYSVNFGDKGVGIVLRPGESESDYFTIVGEGSPPPVLPSAEPEAPVVEAFPTQEQPVEPDDALDTDIPDVAPTSNARPGVPDYWPEKAAKLLKPGATVKYQLRPGAPVMEGEYQGTSANDPGNHVVLDKATTMAVSVRPEQLYVETSFKLDMAQKPAGRDDWKTRTANTPEQERAPVTPGPDDQTPNGTRKGRIWVWRNVATNETAPTGSSLREASQQRTGERLAEREAAPSYNGVVSAFENSGSKEALMGYFVNGGYKVPFRIRNGQPVDLNGKTFGPGMTAALARRADEGGVVLVDEMSGQIRQTATSGNLQTFPKDALPVNAKFDRRGFQTNPEVEPDAPTDAPRNAAVEREAKPARVIEGDTPQQKWINVQEQLKAGSGKAPRKVVAMAVTVDGVDIPEGVYAYRGADNHGKVADRYAYVAGTELDPRDAFDKKVLTQIEQQISDGTARFYELPGVPGRNVRTGVDVTREITGRDSVQRGSDPLPADLTVREFRETRGTQPLPEENATQPFSYADDYRTVAPTTGPRAQTESGAVAGRDYLPRIEAIETAYDEKFDALPDEAHEDFSQLERARDRGNAANIDRYTRLMEQHLGLTQQPTEPVVEQGGSATPTPPFDGTAPAPSDGPLAEEHSIGSALVASAQSFKITRPDLSRKSRSRTGGPTRAIRQAFNTATNVGKVGSAAALGSLALWAVTTDDEKREEVLKVELAPDGNYEFSGSVVDKIEEGLAQLPQVQRDLKERTLDTIVTGFAQPARWAQVASGMGISAALRESEDARSLARSLGYADADVDWLVDMSTRRLDEKEARAWFEVQRIAFSGPAAQRAAYEELVRGNPTQADITETLEAHKNATAEFIGEMFVDPLNLLDAVTFMGRGRIQGRREWGRAQAMMREVHKGVTSGRMPRGVLGGVADALRTSDAKITRDVRDATMQISARIGDARTVDDVVEGLAGILSEGRGGVGRGVDYFAALNNRWDPVRITREFEKRLDVSGVALEAVNTSGKTVERAKALAELLVKDQVQELARARYGQNNAAIRGVSAFNNRIQKPLLSWAMLKVNPGYYITNTVGNVTHQIIDDSLKIGVPATHRAFWRDRVGMVPHFVEEGFDILGNESGRNVVARNLDPEVAASMSVSTALYQHWFPTLFDRALDTLDPSTARRLRGRNIWNVRELEGALDTLKASSTTRTAAREALFRARAGAMGAADEGRGFTLLHYWDKSIIDPFIDLVFPYAYWTTRSAFNWVQRAADHPVALAAYKRVEDAIREGVNGDPDNAEQLGALSEERQRQLGKQIPLSMLNALVFDTGEREIPVGRNVADAFGLNNLVEGEEELYFNILEKMIPFMSMYSFLKGSGEYEPTLDEEVDGRWVNQFLKALNKAPMATNPLMLMGIGFADKVLDLGLDRRSFEVTSPLSVERPLRALSNNYESEIEDATGVDVPTGGFSTAPIFRELSGYGYTQPGWEMSRRGKFLADAVESDHLSQQEAAEALWLEDGQWYDYATRKAANWYAGRSAASFATSVSISGEPNWELAAKSKEFAGRPKAEQGEFIADNPELPVLWATNKTGASRNAHAASTYAGTVSNYSDQLLRNSNPDYDAAKDALYDETITDEQRLLLGTTVRDGVNQGRDRKRQALEARLLDEMDRRWGYSQLDAQYDKLRTDEAKADFRRRYPGWGAAQDWRREQQEASGLFPRLQEAYPGSYRDDGTPFSQPTASQLEYARSIGVSPSGMSSTQVSTAIDRRKADVARQLGIDPQYALELDERRQNGERLPDLEYRVYKRWQDALYVDDSPQPGTTGGFLDLLPGAQREAEYQERKNR